MANRRKVVSRSDALALAETLHAKSSALELIVCLRAVGNGAIAPTLLTRQNIEPLRELMQRGIPFDAIVSKLSVRCLFLGLNHITSWVYLEAMIMSDLEEQ